MVGDTEDRAGTRDWQRLDVWLWHARFMRHRSDCARFVESGLVRLNRQPVAKPHARLRIGDVLTLPFPAQVRVVQVLALAVRRGPAAEARALYRERLPADGPPDAKPQDRRQDEWRAG